MIVTPENNIIVEKWLWGALMRVFTEVDSAVVFDFFSNQYVDASHL